MGFLVRLFRTGDEDGVVRVVKSVYDEYGFSWDPDNYHADLYDLEAHFGGPDWRFWVAEEDGGRILGCGGMHLYEPIPGPPATLVLFEGHLRVAGSDCSLERLYVDLELRRQGVGGALIEQILAEARALGKTGMEIWSDKKLSLAHRMYEKLGAIRIGDRICHDPDQSPEWGMLLELSENLPNFAASTCG